MPDIVAAHKGLSVVGADVLTFIPLAVTIAVVAPAAEIVKSRLALAIWPAVMVSIWLSLRATPAAKDGLAKQNDKASPPKREETLWTMLLSFFRVNGQSRLLCKPDTLPVLRYAKIENEKIGAVEFCTLGGLM